MLRSVSSIYIWSEIQKVKQCQDGGIEIEELIFKFDLDLNNNTMILWTDNLFNDMVR
jgi:hypothetical protein